MITKPSRFQSRLHQMAALSTLCGLAASALLFTSPRAAAQLVYRQHNLVSDIPGLADHTDSDLINPWGMSSSPTGSPIWVSDNGALPGGKSTLYNGAGVKQGLIVTILGAGGVGPGTPTGQVFAGGAGFNAGSGAYIFLFSEEDGSIAGFRGPTTADVPLTVPGAAYKGLALANNGVANFLYAANFATGTLDVINTSLALTGSVSDPTAPAGYAPFNVQKLSNGKVYVTFAKKGGGIDEEQGHGKGFVDVFDPVTNTFTRLASGTDAGGTLSVLDAPWGLAIAPSNFGVFSNDLLVGNFGDEGWINAFDPTSGAFLGQLMDETSHPLGIEGLWGLIPGNGGNGGTKDKIYFTAGIQGEDHGLFGSIQAVPEPGSTALLLALLVPGITLARRRTRA